MSQKKGTQILSNEFDPDANEPDLPVSEAKEPIEVVYLLETRPDQTVGIGNSHECPRSEAIEMIRAGLAKAVSAPIGKIPEEWG